MAKLNILGAQRVKALTEMLDQFEKQAIRELQLESPKQEEIKHQVNQEFGIDDKLKRAKELELELRELYIELRDITGENKQINFQTYSPNTKTEWYKRYQELQQENQQQINKVKEIFADKKRKLWLCETLEEAKEIVGI